VLDTNQDNVADSVYFGTTAGRVYKMDLTTPAPLVDVTVRDRFDRPAAGTTVQRVTAAAWDPILVFQTGDNHPIYEEIQLLSVQKLGRYALAFGTGDRENLWDFDGIPGRFYLIVDDAWTTATGLTEANYRRILPDDPDLTGADANPLLNPTGGNRRGWYLYLDPSERVITKAFGVSGVLIFSSFQPQVFQEGDDQDPQCVRTGTSRNFVVFTTSGNAVTSLTGGVTPERFLEIQDFVTSPFVEQVQTQNVTGGTPPPPTPFDADCNGNPRLRAVADVLKQNGPTNAVYGNYYLRLGQRESKRGVFYPACVPIGVVDRNWKEN
jgi:Tfp pilus tip-associated adhesin PilY1